MNRKGIVHIIPLIVFPLVVIAALVIIWFTRQLEESILISHDYPVVEESENCPIEWVFEAPVDLSQVSGILYPGQDRGGEYKPHGGFRFDGNVKNNVEVRAIMDGYVLKISEYEDDWATQKLLFYVNDCGIMVMHDHIVEVSDKLQELYDQIEVGKNSDSRTTDVSNQRVEIKKGEILATTIGYDHFPGGANGKNIFVDFGLYDLENSNGVEYSAEDRKKYPNIDSYGNSALCWFDYLSSEDSKLVRGLPATGSSESDYCN